MYFGEQKHEIVTVVISYWTYQRERCRGGGEHGISKLMLHACLYGLDSVVCIQFLHGLKKNF